jgi:Glycosyl hydrolase family 85
MPGNPQFLCSYSLTISFSHHRVTIPPSGWNTAAHRQGVKMLGTLCVYILTIHPADQLYVIEYLKALAKKIVCGSWWDNFPNPRPDRHCPLRLRYPYLPITHVSWRISLSNVDLMDICLTLNVHCKVVLSRLEHWPGGLRYYNPSLKLKSAHMRKLYGTVIVL